jgi:crotonobetainyl-CoA:carnitine CoA-transferase CaiB-like acyl-CoA transferase
MSIEEDLWSGGGDGPLAGVRAVDFGQYLAGPMLAMLLADQGADVVRVDPPGGPRWDTPVNAVLLRGRRNLILDLTEEADRARAGVLIGSADIVIENFRPGVADRLGIGPSPSIEGNSRLIYVSLPGFGQDDPRAGVAAWEGVVMASTGAYMVPESTVPMFSALPLGSVFAALESSVAVVGALIARDRDGLGQRIEMPLFDALFEAGGAGVIMERPQPFKYGDLALAWYRCADDRYIALGSAWFRHLEWFVRAAGCEAWIDEGIVDYDQMMSDPAAVAEVKARLVDLFAQRPAAEWEILGRAHGCSLAMTRSLAEWLAEDHPLAAGTLVDAKDPELGLVRAPGSAVRISTYPQGVAAPRRPPDADGAELRAQLDAILTQAGSSPAAAPNSAIGRAAPPLTGLRVLDLTRVAAAPTATKLLAQYGADVIKIDTNPTDRAMVTEPIGHDIVNRGKRSIRLDLYDPADREVFGALLSTADALVQNFTLGVDQRLGIDEAAVRRNAPDIVYSYLNAYGTTGPWAGARGYADLLNCITGICDRTLGDRVIESGHPLLMVDRPRWAFTDYAAGALAAFATMLGLLERGRTARAPRVETSLERAVTLEQLIYTLDYEGRDIYEPRGDAPGWAPLQRLYDTADGAVFVGAREAQSDDLLGALEVDTLEKLPEAFATQSTQSIIDTLLTLDIGVQRVEPAGRLLADDGVAALVGLRVENYSAANGRVLMAGPVARLSRTPPVPGPLAAPFGAHSEEIRQELGFTIK